MKLIVNLLLLALALQGKAQVQLRSRYLTDTSKAILYIGVENRFEITTADGKPGDYTVVATGADSHVLHYGSAPNDLYQVRVSSPGNCELSILKKGKQIWKRSYLVESVAPPIPTLGGLYTNDTISKNRVLLAAFLAPAIRGCYWKHIMTVTGFTAVFISQNDGDSIRVSAIGNSFNPEQIRRIKELKPGDEIYFDNIRSTNNNGCARKLPSFFIKIE